MPAPVEVPRRTDTGAAPTPSGPDFARLLALALVPQAGMWAAVMTLSFATLERIEAGERVLRSPLGGLLRFGEPWTAVCVSGAGILLGLVVAAIPGAGRERARVIQGLGLAFTAALVVWSHASLTALPFLAEVLGEATPTPAHAWALVPVALGALLLLYLWILGDDGKGAFPTLEIAHLFVLVAALSLPFVSWDMDRRLPLDLALLWSGSLGAALAGLVSGFALDRAWRTMAQPHRGFGPWFILVVSSATALAVVRRLTYVFDVATGR